MSGAGKSAGTPTAAEKRLIPAIIRELELAADILRRLPLPSHGKPAPPPASWPEIVQDSWRIMMMRLAAPDAARARQRATPARPSPAEIDAMDRVLAWLWWLDAGQRRVVWARALKFSWRRLAAALACTTAQARYRHRLALRALARRLHAQGFDVRAVAQGGEAQADWTEEKWDQARRAGITWVLQAPLRPRISRPEKFSARAPDSASQV